MGVRRKFTSVASVNEAWSRPGARDAAPTPPAIYDPVDFAALLGTEPFPVNTSMFNGVDQPTMTALSSGGFVVVWMDGYDVRAQRFDSEGEKVGAVIAVNALSHAPQGQQHVVGLASGGFVVSWAGLDGSSGLGIWARTFDANGQPVTGDVLLNTETVGNEQQPVLAALSSGGFVAGWTDSNGDASGTGVKAQIFDSLGAKVGGELLVNTTTTLNQYFPRSAGLPGGGFVIAWTSSGPTEVRAQIFDSLGVKQGNEIVVNAGPGEKNFEAVTVLASGNFVIAWADKLGDVDVKGQLFTAAGAPIGGEFTINTTEAGNQEYPSLAALPDGGFVATWRDATGVGNYENDGEIKARFFDASGTAVGGEFLVNVDTQGGQTLPSAASFGSGDLAFIWLDYSYGAVMARTFFSATLGTNGDDIFAGTGDRDFYLGLDGNDTIGGGAGRDILIGGAGDDTILGGADADLLIGEAGDDALDGGDGNDELDGGDGDDGLDGGAGDDTLNGGEGNDTIEAGGGRDSLHGDEGNDTLNAAGSNDVWMFGGLGDDRLTASNGLFRMFGDEGGSTSEDGDDHLTLTNGATGSWLDGGGGDDILIASGSGQLTIGGGTGNNDITVQGFTHGSVTLLGGDDIVRLPASFIGVVSFGGRDTIIINSIGPGFMNVNGLNAGEEGDRFDLSIYGADPFGVGTLIFSSTSGNIVIDHPTTGMRYVFQGVAAADLSAYNLGVPNPLYAPQDMVLDDAFANSPTEWDGELVGADGNDLIRGYAGNDLLYGAGGNDRLEGGTGADFLNGGSGNDTLIGDADADTMIGRGGNDTYFVDDAGDSVFEAAGEGYDIVAAGLSYVLTEESEIELLTTGWVAGSAAIDFTGNELANQIWGNDGVNILNGAGGNDALFGFGGNDTLIGGLGDDTMFIDAAGDNIVEADGEGYDALAAGLSYTLGAGVEIELITTGFIGGTAAIDFTGNDFANQIWGNAANNILNGGGGNDALFGFDGNDTLIGGADADLLIGGAGADAMSGGTGDDTFFVDDAGDTIVEAAGEGFDVVAAGVTYALGTGAEIELLTTGFIAGTAAINFTGNELANQIWGNDGVNILNGGGGNDELFGFGGNDTLIGGTGNDTMFIDSAGDTLVEAAGEGYDVVAAGISYTLGAGVEIELITTGFIGGIAAIDFTGNDFANQIWGNA
ncbi:MAG TPA: calcium-binding protein, partial [Allosphingosinicella sp.]